MPQKPAVTISRAALMLAFVTLAASAVHAEQADDQLGDPERGRIIFRSVGYCVSCHGWPGDGKTGTNLQAPVGPNLRQTELDAAALIEVIGCGRPGSSMPYHDRAAYRDGRCFEMNLSDFAPGSAPVPGKTFSDRDVANVVAYLQTYVIGLGEPTYVECAEFYNNPAAHACSSLQ